MLRRPLAALVSIVALLVLAPTASAHTHSRFPRFGEVGDTFTFKGRAWQPSRRVRWFYDESNDGEFDRAGRFFANSFGRFTFTWSNADAGTHRLCFRQFDTRPRFERTFQKCKRFTAVTD